jgi:hypothetical protein
VQLVRWLTSSPTPITEIHIERGFQRADKRENFGFLDGLRNPGVGTRTSTALVGLDLSGDEPAWVEGAAYLTYMRSVRRSRKPPPLTTTPQSRSSVAARTTAPGLTCSLAWLR